MDSNQDQGRRISRRRFVVGAGLSGGMGILAATPIQIAG